MNVVNEESKVIDIARAWPETMQVFASYNLDLCCGGGHPLREAAARHHLDLPKLMREINSAIEKQHAGRQENG